MFLGKNTDSSRMTFLYMHEMDLSKTLRRFFVFRRRLTSFCKRMTNLNIKRGRCFASLKDGTFVNLQM